MGATEILLLAVVTWGLAWLCLRDALRIRRSVPGHVLGGGVWIGMILIGAIACWPFAWTMAVAHVRERRRNNPYPHAPTS